MLLLSYRCLFTVNVLWLFLPVTWVGLQYVVVVFPSHTNLLFGQAHRGLAVGFILLLYSVVYIVLSPYLCCTFFLYLDLYVLGDDA